MAINRFRFRPFISLLTGFSFIILTVTGAVLFITPPGRVANWTNWTFWGLTKHQWGAVHICFSALFVIASLFHIWLNIKPLMHYFASKIQHVRHFRFEWIGAAVLCGIVCWGALVPFAPFSSLLDLNEDVKQGWSIPQEQPPIPHAELLTVAEFAEKAEIAPDALIENFNKQGIEASGEDVFGDIAKRYEMSPDELYAAALGKSQTSQRSGGGSGGRGGGSGGGGFGQKTLRQACEEMNIDVEQAIQKLKADGISCSADQTIRAIADASNLHPSQIRQILENSQ